MAKPPQVKNLFKYDKVICEPLEINFFFTDKVGFSQGFWLYFVLHFVNSLLLSLQKLQDLLTTFDLISWTNYVIIYLYILLCTCSRWVRRSDRRRRRRRRSSRRWRRRRSRWSFGSGRRRRRRSTVSCGTETSRPTSFHPCTNSKGNLIILNFFLSRWRILIGRYIRITKRT